MLRSFVVFFSTGVFSAAALAGGTVTSVRGEVRADGKPVAVGQSITAPAVLETGAGAQVVLRFDDGGQVALHENTFFRIVDSGYSERDPKGDRAIFDLERGTARFTTGAVAARTPTNWNLRAPQATLQVRREADFIASLVNPLYVRVLQGTVLVNNAYAVVPFGAVSNVAVAHSNALATPIAVSALPGPTLTAFSSMGSVPMTVAGGPASGAAGTGAAGGVGAGTIAAAAAVVAAVAAAAGGGGGGGGSSAQHHAAPSH